MAVHSQDMNIPNCPRGWESLWLGYSFAMVCYLAKVVLKYNSFSRSILDPELKVEDKHYPALAHVWLISGLHPSSNVMVQVVLAITLPIH